MRPYTKSYTPAAADLVGFLSNATGATWTLTATNSADSLAHTVTIRNDSVTDHSAKTAVLVGTDIDGKPQTETLNLPGTSATVTSLKAYLTLTSVTPSATIGADTMDIGWSAVSFGQTLPLDGRSICAATIGLEITGTINVDVEETFGNVYSLDTPPSTLMWTGVPNLTGITASVAKVTTLNAQAVRFNVNSVTAGATVKVYVSQASQLTG